eukprot:TRINITY_DN2102_c0_g1_i4.p1 TRINITY_DN2102_c0_g1~~TRINITY_DN2102_c0_g1_i4.p1  ORF type:complete len:626 (+),score=67.10 TRINITY_DN2102_c0_g1_i4:91-1968(+)
MINCVSLKPDSPQSRSHSISSFIAIYRYPQQKRQFGQTITQDICFATFQRRRISSWKWQRSCQPVVAETRVATEKQVFHKDRVLSYQLRNARTPSRLQNLLKNREITPSLDCVCVAACATSMAQMLQNKWQIRSQYEIREEDFMLQINQLYTHLSELIERYLPTMGDREISNCLTSLARARTLGILTQTEQKTRQDEIIQKLVQKAIGLQNFRGIYLSSVLWALNKLSYKNVLYVRKLAQKVLTTKVEEYDAQAASIAVWTFAKFQIDKLNEVQAIEFVVNLAKERVQIMDGREIGNLAWGLRRLRYFDYYLLKAIAKTVKDNCFQFNTQIITNVTLLFADFGITFDKLKSADLEDLVQVLVAEFLPCFERKNCYLYSVANFIYALSLIQAPIELTQKVVDKVVERFGGENQYSEFKLDEFNQIGRAQLQYSAYNEKLVLPEELEKTCVRWMQLEAKREQASRNSFCEEVYNHIKVLYPDAVYKPLVHNEMLEVNIAIVKGDKKVAIQCISSKCFMLNLQGQMMGSTKAYYDLLKGFGWTVVIIRLQEWRRKIDYSRKSLKLIDNILNLQEKYEKLQPSDQENATNDANADQEEEVVRENQTNQDGITTQVSDSETEAQEDEQKV